MFRSTSNQVVLFLKIVTTYLFFYETMVKSILKIVTISLFFYEKTVKNGAQKIVFVVF